MHIPWFTAFLRKLPFALEADGKMNNFAINRVRLRKANGALTKDLFYHLVGCYPYLFLLCLMKFV